ncbi:MAG: efflux RND transporter periplasmic adaptor subunit, partial [Microbacterium sp.]
TKTGTVAQGAAFHVHATVTGTVTAIATDSFTITPDEGESIVITVPAGARLETVLVEQGERVAQGIALADASYPGFAIALTLEAADLLRFVTPPLGIRAQVAGGSGPFDCTLLDPVPSVGSEDATTSLLCAVPETATVLAGMTATTVIQLERAENALILPVEAVAGTVDSGSVYLRGADGEAIETPVTLGTTDGTRIVVTGGVIEGDVVLVPGPWLEGRNE